MIRVVKRNSRKRDDKFLENQSGSPAVEFAMLGLPIMVFLMGIINFGYALFGLNQMQAATNETIRAIAYAEMSEAEAEVFLKKSLSQFGGDKLVISVNSAASDTISIKVTGKTDFLTLADFPFASLQHYQEEFTVTSVAPKFKMSSVASR